MTTTPNNDELAMLGESRADLLAVGKMICCGVADERGIVECHRCGKQWTVPCSFDEDYS